MSDLLILAIFAYQLNEYSRYNPLMLDSIRLEILQLRADSSAQQGSETFDSSLLLDVELQSSFAEEKKIGTEKKETIMKKKEKKAKKKKVGDNDNDDEEEERAEEGAESSITRARRLLGITDGPSTARSIHEGDSKTKTKSRRRRGRTARGAEDDHHNILSGFIPMGPGDSGDDDEEEEDDDCDALNVESIVTNSKAQVSVTFVTVINFFFIPVFCDSVGCYP